MMALGIDTLNLVTEWLPRMEHVLYLAPFAKSYQVHRVYVCAIELSTDEGAIEDLSRQTPAFSVTQAALDWQPDEELDEGEVYSYLLHMGGPPQKARDEALYSRLSSSQRHFVSALSPRFAARAGGRPASAFERKSFRLSTMEVYGIDCVFPGYHVGSTSFVELLKESDAQNIPNEWWKSFVDDEGPALLGRPDRSAVLWQVQVDILDLSKRNFSQPAPKRQRRYGPFLQLREEPAWDPAAEARQFHGVRYRPERRNFIAETRLPKRRNKVSFGDFKSSKEAARAIDAVFYYYGFCDKFNFTDTPKILSKYPKPPDALDDEAKLKFVKERAKLVASLALRLPSSSASAIAPPVARSLASSSVLALTGSTGPPPEFSMDAVADRLGLLERITQVFGDQFGDSSCEYNVEDPWVAGYGREQWNGNLELVHSRSTSVDESTSGMFKEQGPAESRSYEFQDRAESSGDKFQRPAAEFHSDELQVPAGSPYDQFQGSCNEFQGPAFNEFQDPACDEFQCRSLQVLCVQSPGPALYQTDSPWVGFQDDIAHVLLQQQQFGFDVTALEVEELGPGVGQEPRYSQRKSRGLAGSFFENAGDFSHSIL